ncbi:MAG: hypothetical protein CMB49_00220 [Euryarchaeota archaeon]|nr:hypothetical protein [Euryarchaeota archaeon]
MDIVYIPVQYRLLSGQAGRGKKDGKNMTKGEYSIQDLLQREVFVNQTKVGVIVGERHHPNEARVQSMRIQVIPEIAEEYMRKPAELAPLPKELVHSIRADGAVKLSKSMRELQRRWRNTVRIDEKLYAPDEMIDRALLDNQGMEIGVVTELVKVKRTYRGVCVKVRSGIQRQYGVEPVLRIPITAISRTRERLDEVVLSRTFEKTLQLPSFLQINDPDYGLE